MHPSRSHARHRGALVSIALLLIGLVTVATARPADAGPSNTDR
jgi:hypothetical protein